MPQGLRERITENKASGRPDCTILTEWKKTFPNRMDAKETSADCLVNGINKLFKRVIYNRHMTTVEKEAQVSNRQF